MSCFWGHEWNKWQSYKSEELHYYPATNVSTMLIITRQKRVCKDCGFVEDVFVCNGWSGGKE